MTSVLVLGNTPSALEVTRSLGRSGHRIVVGTSSLACYANLSRHCAETWHHPPISESVSSFLEALADFLRARSDVTVIYPTEDAYLLRFAGHRDRLPADIAIVMPDRRLVQLSDDKLAMHALVGELGIPQAPYAVAQGKAELFEQCDALGYPCVVLHADSRDAILGRKAMIIASREHLDMAFRYRPDFDGRLLVRAFARGKRYNYYLVAAQGRIVDGMQLKVSRTDRLDDTGAIVEGWSSAPSPDITRYTEKLLSHLNYTGPALIQFIVDETTGAMVFLEINPRLGAGCAVARHAGIDLVRLAFDQTCGTLPAEQGGQSDYPDAMCFAWLGGDLNGLRRDWRRGEIGPGQAIAWLGRAIRTAIRADAHICGCWDDPLPAIGSACWEILFAIRKRLGREPAAMFGHARH